MLFELNTKGVLPKPANQLYRIAKTGNGDSLIRTFTARMNLKISTENRLPLNGNPLRIHYEIDVDATDDHNWLFARKHSFSFISANVLPCLKTPGQVRSRSVRTEKR